MDWLLETNWLLFNCQSFCVLERRQYLLKCIHSNYIFLCFVTGTWLSDETNDSEVFLGVPIKVLFRSDQAYGEHSGFIIVYRILSNFTILD